MCKIIFNIAILIMFIHSAFADDDKNVFFPKGDKLQDIDTVIEYLDDRDGNYSFQLIANEKQSLFKPLKKMNLGFGYKGAIWLKFKINLSKYRDTEWYLLQGYEHVGSLTIYYPDLNGNYLASLLTEYSVIEDRVLNVHQLLFKIPKTDINPATYYLRMEPGSHVLFINLKWSGVKGILAEIHDSMFMLGIIFGGLIIMWLYSAVLCAYHRNGTYLYFSYYLIFFIIWSFYKNGFAAIASPINPYIEHIYSLFGFGMLHGMTLFVREFLEMYKSKNLVDKILNLYLYVCQYLVLFAGFVSLFLNSNPFIILNVMIFITIGGMFIAGIHRVLNKFKPAYIYLIGWLPFGIMLVINSINSLALTSSRITINNGLMYAALWESFIFTLGLAYSIKLSERSKNIIQIQKMENNIYLLKNERTHFEEMLKERTDDLNYAIASRQTMIANASHDLRTPANSLRLLIQATELEGKDPSFIMPNIKTLIDYMCQVIETILLLDPDQKMARDSEEIFDVGEELLKASKIATQIKTEKNVCLNINIDGCKGLFVRAKRGSISRIVVNLLSNAWKYTYYGEVSLNAHVTGLLSNKYILTVRITDTGCGIPHFMHKKIFDMFITAHSNKNIGTGIGLPIALKLATELGGSLELIESVVNSGSIFEFKVPLYEPYTSKDLNVKKYESRQQLPLVSKNVLLAEDDAITAQTVKVIIGLLKHKVTHVMEYKQLLDALLTNTFDVAFVDNRLLGGSGMDAIIHYRNIPNNKTRIVLMTADASSEFLLVAHNVCDEVVIKPTSAEFIKKLLGGEFPEIKKVTMPDENQFININVIKALIDSGISKAKLNSIIELFLNKMDSNFEEVKNIVDNKCIGDKHKRLNDIIHRICSSCSSIGAFAMEKEFKVLADCTDDIEFKSVFNKIVQIYKDSKNTLILIVNNDN